VFDCDGTLWSGDSGADFFYWELDRGLVAPEVAQWATARYQDYKAGNVDEDTMCGEMVAINAGSSLESLQEAAEEFFSSVVEPRIFPEMLRLTRELDSIGCEVWAVSSTNDWVVREGVKRFGIPRRRNQGMGNVGTRSWIDNLLWHHGCHSVDIAQWVMDNPNWDCWGQKGPDHKELGIPMDLDEAVGTVVAGHMRTVDVGEVNGHFFLNNSSLGIYPEVVREREEIRHHGIASKWAAMARAAIDQLRRFPMVTVTLRLPDRGLRVTSPLIFVGNNRYEMKLLRIGRRSHLDRGELFLYVARDRSRLGFLALAVRALRGRLDPEKDFVSAGLPYVEVATSWRRTLRVALDGEVMRLSPPLRYRIRPRALRVLAPPAPA